ncbi:hypothetical protein DsansV1_C02g0018741 [Dioscorea sansibarensis]
MEVELGGLKNVEASAFSGDGAPASEAATPASLMKLVLSSMVAAGMQYGWALQFALLTSYVQVLMLDFVPCSITRCKLLYMDFDLFYLFIKFMIDHSLFLKIR